ncbi:MAG: isocitrate lyase/phosphoenolpyruvate mutase family protein [Sphingomonas sp.]|nr:isocitrate lyase/phosphoenolpyruvate mutase family protein [Sphingomonas sp.]
MSDKFTAFAKLHVPGNPLVLFNVWDAGSAAAVERAGAKALATGSWSVAAAQGCHDAEGLPLDLALANAARIAAATALPVSIDFEGGYATDPMQCAANVAALAATGAIGCNFEDQVIGTASRTLHPLSDQVARISAVRRAVGSDFFLNARTDIFLGAPGDAHDAAMVDAAIERALAYADAGASGLFVPGLVDLKLLEKVCSGSPLPVNFMAFNGAPGAAQVAQAGVARISHGPGPYRLAMKALTEAARVALG